MIRSLKTFRTQIPVWGFTLIELAIVLGVAGLLFAGLWRLMSGGNQQLRDQAAASSQTQLISAVKGYLATQEGQTYMANNNASATAPFGLALPTSNTSNADCVAHISTSYPGFCTYLPAGFTSANTNSYGQNYNINILGDGAGTGKTPNTYSFMILTTGGTAIPDSSGGRISSSIGGDGGFVYSNNVCNSTTGAATNLSACGAYGAWGIATTAYGYNAGYSGSVATRTYVSPEQNSTNVWLARSLQSSDQATPKNPTYNKMIADLFIGPNGSASQQHTGGTNGDIGWINFMTGGGAAGQINMNGGAINMGTATGSLNMAGGPLHMAGGLIDGVGSITMNPGTITNVSGITMGTSGPIDMSGGIISDGYISLVTPQPPTTGHLGFITLSTGCTVYNNSNPSSCPAAMYVTTGDVIVAGGEVEANELYATSFIYQGSGGTSDIRLKANVHSLEDSIQNIMKLKPVDFTFKSNNKESFGFIAQDVEKIYPQLVAESQGTKYINYDGLIAPLVQAVQELQQENAQMREEIKSQSQHERKLEQELRTIKSVP